MDVLSFLNAPCEADEENYRPQLEEHPYVKRVFVKYNTIIPSSAEVERLFSVASNL